MPHKIKTVISLYRGTGLTEEKRLCLDAIGNYVNSRPSAQKLVLQDIMLEKSMFDSLNVNVRLALDPTQLTFHMLPFDYMEIYAYPSQASGNCRYYYFVKRNEWLSTGAIALECRLDTLNTLVAGGLVGFGPRTVTRRRHKSRFVMDDDTTKLIRLVDKYDEGLYPIQYRTKWIRLNEEGQSGVQWNLVYRNANQPSPTEYYQINPVEMHITTDDDRAVIINPTVYDILEATDFTGQDGDDYLLDMNDWNSGITAEVSGVTTPIADNWPLMVHRDGAVIELCRVNQIAGTYYKGDILVAGGTIRLYNLNASTLHFANVTLPWSGTPSYSDFTVSLTKTSASIKGIYGTYDRTDPRLIRVAKVPYPPVAIPVADGVAHIPNGWEYSASFGDLKKTDINTRFSRVMELKMTENPLLSDMVLDPVVALRNPYVIDHESKLYHSAFHTIKFAYDSFFVSVPLENLTSGTSPSRYEELFHATDIQVQYTVSTTMSGKFMFQFNVIAAVYDSTEDYPYTMTIARNNEEPVFTSAYVNYLRNGYNYDVKAKSLSAMSSGAMIAAGIGSGAILGAMGGNPVGAIAGAVVGGVSAAISTAFSQISAEQAIQQRLNNAKNQAVNVTGSDDVDLMVQYAKNRLHIVEYEPSLEMRSTLFDLFYLYGYACNETGVPLHNNRYYFDFLQCDPEFTYTSTLTVFSPEFLNDLRDRFNAGVTFLHEPLTLLGYITCDYENWEREILMDRGLIQ